MNVTLTLIIEFIFFLVFIGFSAFFSSSEMALFSLSRAKILSYRDSESVPLRRINLLMGDYHKTLITIILGNMFVNSCISMLNDEMLSKLALSPMNTMILSAFSGIIVLLLFGEITPMTVAYIHSDMWAKKVASPIYYFRKLLSPVTSVVGSVCDKILDLLGRETSAPLSHDEYISFIESAKEHEVFTNDEAELLKETFSLRTKNVDEIMRSRVDLVHVSPTIGCEELADVIRESRQAYMPVGNGTIDDVDSIVSSVEFFRLPPEKRAHWQKFILHRAEFLPETSTLNKVLHTMNEKKIKAVLVADEYGGVAGMLTIEDIYSELAGRSVELNEQDEWEYIRLNEHSWIFDGMVSLEYVRRNSDWSDCNLDEEFDATTLNGLFCEAFGALPQINDSIHIGDVELKALSVSRNRVAKVMIHMEHKHTENSEPKEVDI